ncbi:BTAD domain-containing putative transcriptional regulator [Streptomyces sp. NPDC004111]|uniref:AfsR/SARP family transcriptional regulator n=1 Tax=Streptomyces sp. NPDC004111 TaxID=3364690 RepID=UPI0036A580FE
MVTAFSVFGSVEARIAGEPVPLGHARQQSVLVALLVDVNKLVPVDRLVDRVWAEDLPQRARSTLQSYLSRLRKSLSGADDTAIQRRAGGYVLTADPAAFDLHRFKQLIDQARTLDDDERARDLFDRALRLWQGQPFGALDTPWLAALRERLVREHLAAELDRNDVVLRLGGHPGLLAPLAGLTEQHPLDERLAAQMMVALYRCGRPADALHHYRNTRIRLSEELGIDPSVTLQRLHQQILVADPTLTLTPSPATITSMPPAVPNPATAGPVTPAAPRPSTAGPVTPAVVPNQLPLARRIVGRSRELDQLTRHLDTVNEGTGTVVITAIGGTAGVGKTTLALSWAQQVRHRFPDGQIYVNLRGFDPTGTPMDPAAAVRGFLDALAYPAERIPVGADAQAGLYRSLVSGKRMLIVLDNARDTDQVRPLLPGSPTCAVVVTSRRQLAGLIAAGQARCISLDVLSRDEARALLHDALGRDRRAEEDAAIDELIHLCSRLPLALTIAGARAHALPHLPLSALVEELRVEHRRIGALSTGDSVSTDLSTVFSWSYQALSPEAARLFRLLGLHPGPDTDASAAAALTGREEIHVRSLLGELTAAHLLHQHHPGRYQFHDLLRAYAAECAVADEPDREQAAATRRLFDHYLCTAHRADHLLDQHRDPITLPPATTRPLGLLDHQQALDWFTAELPVLLAGIRQAANTGLYAHAWRLPWTLHTFLQRRGHWQEWTATQRIALDSAQHDNDPEGLAHCHYGLGVAHSWNGQYNDAYTHLSQALDLYVTLRLDTGRAHTHRAFAWALQHQGRHREALVHAEHTLTFYQAANFLPGQASALNAIGWYHAQLGHLDVALANCNRALVYFQKVGNRTGEAHTWDSLGFIHHSAKHHAEAINCYEQALSLFVDLEDQFLQAETLRGLGLTQQSLGHTSEARDSYTRALRTLDALGHPDAEKLRKHLENLPAPGR